MGEFIAGMVADSTAKLYRSGWTHCKVYLRSLSSPEDELDPYLLKAADDKERACRVGLFPKDRYEVEGLRDRATTGVIAHVRYHFSIALHPTEFFDMQIITRVRKVCRMTTAELKLKKKNDNATTKLMVCEDILYNFFEDNRWTSTHLDNRMTYMGAMWGFNVGVRIGEMTAPE